MKYIEALCILVALGSALARPQSEGRASRLEDDWRPMSNLRYVRYLDTTSNNMYTRIIPAINHNTRTHLSNSTESSVDELESEHIKSMSEDLKQVFVALMSLISTYFNEKYDISKILMSQTQIGQSDLKLGNHEDFDWLKLIMNSKFDEKLILDKLNNVFLFLSKSYSENKISKLLVKSFYKNGENDKFLRFDKDVMKSRRKRQVSSEETLDYDSEEDPDTSSESSDESSKPNELYSDDSYEVESSDEDDREDSSVVTSSEAENDKKDMSDDDNVIVESFVSNSLSDLKSAHFDHKNPGHKPSVIVSGHTDESLDDLILHHTGSSGVIHHPANQKHRPSVILVQDAPEHLLPKPPTNYRPSNTHHTTVRPNTSINNQNNNNYHNTIHRPQNNIHSQGPSYKPVYHYPSPEPNPEPVYVPLPNPPKPSQSHKPVYNNKPLYQFSTTEPSIITVEHLYRPLHLTTTVKPPTSTYKPAHDEFYHYPNHHAEPNFEPVPIYHPHQPQDIHRPIYKPVHHYPVPQPGPEPGHVPIYQGSYPSPEPQPEPEFVHHYPDDDHEPVYLISSSTQEPVPSPKPASPTQSSPIVQSNTPLGPTLIFINQQNQQITSLPSPSPSPLNPVTISNGEPPPSIVLLPPLNDVPPTAQDAPPPAPHCAPVYVSHTQNIHTSADFKDDCAEVNIIINSPVAAAIGGGGGGGGELGSEEEDEEQVVQQDDDPGGGGGGGGGGGLIVPIIAAAGAGGAAAAAAAGAAGAAGTAGIVGGAVAGGTAGSAVTPRPNLPLQNAPSRPTSLPSSSLVQQAPPTPTKRPESSMTLWDYFTSAFTSFAYPFWTIVFAPFSLLLASGLGVAALVFPWAFPRFWFGREIRGNRRKRRRKRSSDSVLEFAPMISQLDFYAELFEKRLNSHFNFSRIFNR